MALAASGLRRVHPCLPACSRQEAEKPTKKSMGSCAQPTLCPFSRQNRLFMFITIGRKTNVNHPRLPFRNQKLGCISHLEPPIYTTPHNKPSTHHALDGSCKLTGRFTFKEMALPLETLRELVTLASRKMKIGNNFEALTKHVKGGNFLSGDQWEALDLAWDLRQLGVLSEDEYAEQIDSQILGIVGSAPANSPKETTSPSAEASGRLSRTERAAEAGSRPANPEPATKAKEKPGNWQWWISISP